MTPLVRVRADEREKDAGRKRERERETYVLLIQRIRGEERRLRL